MLKIRQQQWNLLSQLARAQFEESTLQHLRTYWPARCDELQEAGVRASIQEGVLRAKQYGLVTEFDILRYINHMYALGFDFDRNNAYPWVLEILTSEIENPSERMDRLSERTQQELRA